MTSYQFFKMAAAADQYYFRFRICWCHCLHRSQSISKPNFVNISPFTAEKKTTFVFEKQTSAISEFHFRFRSRPFRHNLHVILHLATDFCPNRSTHCGHMTSYPFLKMAAAAAQYCFRFCICWCHCLQKVKVYQHTKFRRHILVHGWDITTSCLEKQPSTILEFYLRFRCQPFRRNRRVILHQGAEFLPNRTTHCGIMTSYRFSRWRPSAMLYLLWGNVMADHPRSAFRGRNLVLKFLFVGLILPEILRCINFGVLAWNCPFTPILGEFLGAYFPRWRHPSSWPPKGPSLGGNTSFEPFSVRIGATVRAGRVTKKKMDRMTKKSQKCYISCIMGKPLINRFVPKSLGGWCRRLNHVCPVLNWNLHGLRFYMGRIFDFPVDFCMCLTTVQR